jgi:hypothetical protein
MKDVWEVLGQKALELSRVEEQVEALRVAAPLLSENEESDNDNDSSVHSVARNVTPEPDHSGWEISGTPQESNSAASPEASRLKFDKAS